MKKSFALLTLFFVYTSVASTVSDYSFEGSHFVASYKACDQTALLDIPHLRQAMLKAAEASGAQVLNYQSHEFPGGGFTMVIMLSESHASIHTYPEFGACFVDLFTCGTTCSSSNFDRSLRAYLKPEYVDGQLIERK
ncbi:adenosylmethionine decarboxylase [Candidatus Dependentiae bacterium]|nr:adenosylmethionine decarboxylase [Candidatus Dependentiae bacterium]MCC7414984.1 adenosylmethionine decarboxylase [Campylobacterota bacterium]